ncbi:PGPGW domain-containing protein [Paenibacillus sp. TRM 82003]|uniref:PGPGW domain-containing protein n=1 Tax=Kineococcus sp. TRM81007 TaxID=2925831 RepID=UPI001F57E817|nr:PGPGW domain-containing protein [Kineococcus sp. TRM81007]MCI2239474.1 PGPGW domain-containing protein [Kineococcus sp. TRM81007]MCI3919274.1 PGPGW domain-containing protein [Paenibacillus sp. TRM 82003]
MARSAQAVKKTAVTVGGGALTLAGVVLLVLPGPGFVLVAAGLAVLATQYAWARRPLRRAQREAWRGVDEVGERRSRAVLSVVCAVVLVVLGVLGLVGVGLPLLGAWSGAFLVLSGVFLGAVVAWAHTGRGRRARAGYRARTRRGR